jgi:hypothetical protein
MANDSYDWFNEKYSDGKKPSLDDRVHLLRDEKFPYTENQIRRFRNRIKSGLYNLRKECKPDLIIRVYSYITALSLSRDIDEGEILDYSNELHTLILRRCEEFHSNFE